MRRFLDGLFVVESLCANEFQRLFITEVSVLQMKNSFASSTDKRDMPISFSTW